MFIIILEEYLVNQFVDKPVSCKIVKTIAIRMCAPAIF